MSYFKNNLKLKVSVFLLITALIFWLIPSNLIFGEGVGETLPAEEEAPPAEEETQPAEETSTEETTSEETSAEEETVPSEEEAVIEEEVVAEEETATEETVPPEEEAVIEEEVVAEEETATEETVTEEAPVEEEAPAEAFVYSPSISSDKDKYISGEQVTISGGGFIPDEKVEVAFINADVGIEHIGVVYADGAGNFSYQYVILGSASYTVQARSIVADENGELVFLDAATTTFADEQIKLMQWADADADWITGALNASKSNYSEGEVIPDMLEVLSSPIGTLYNFTVRYNFQNPPNAAYDYLDTFDTSRDPTLPFGTLDDTDPLYDEISIPIDSDAYVASLMGTDGLFILWGATFAGGGGVIGPTTDTNDKYYAFTVTSTAESWYLLWGGHLASIDDWPAGGSSSISGAPFHMKTGGGLGSKDLPVQPGAILPPPAGNLYVYKFEDLNGDGVWNGAETGLINWNMTLTPGGISQLTDIDGETIFADLAAESSYTVTETLQAGWVNTTALAQGGTMPADGSDAFLYFGNYEEGTITAYKFEDLNGDGIENGSDAPLSGWTMTLKQGAVVIDSDTTNASGEVVFSNLAPGDYTVYETLKTDWVNTTGNHPGGEAVTGLQSGDSERVEFGNCEEGSITVIKFNDLDGDGVKDAGEPLLNGWDMTVNGSTQTTGSNGLGTTIFTGLAPGNYTVTETLKAGWAKTYEVPSGGAVTLQSGGSETVTFGNYLPPVILGSIGDYIWRDVNKNGVWDPGEFGLAGVTVYLYGPVNLVTETNASGFYLFSNLPPGTYTIYVDLTDPDIPDGYGLTTVGQYVVALGPGTTYLDADFGFYSPPTITVLGITEELPFTGMNPFIPISGISIIGVGAAMLIMSLRRRRGRI